MKKLLGNNMYLIIQKSIIKSLFNKLLLKEVFKNFENEICKYLKVKHTGL